MMQKIGWIHYEKEKRLQGMMKLKSEMVKENGEMKDFCKTTIC